MSTDVSKAFKRINFFRGFLTTEEDWNSATAYHVEKHRMHNRMLHGFGVVPGFLGELRVQARGKGELAVEILPGLAVDGDGNEIFVPDPEIKAVNPLDYKLPQTIYVVAKYYEEMTDFIAYKENLEYKGHRRIAEVSRIELHVVEPEPADGVELARIALEPGVKRLTDGRDPRKPSTNEIDLRFVPFAGAVGTHIPTHLLAELADLLKETCEVYGHITHKESVTTAGDSLHAAITLHMMLRSRIIDMWNLFDMWDDILWLQWGFVEQIEADRPDISSRKEFASYKRHIELLRDFSREGRRDADALRTLLSYEAKANENLRAIFFGITKREVEERAPTTPIEKIGEILKVHSGSFDESMEVEGVVLKRADEIDVLNKKSETAHDFRIIDYRDRYRSRQKLKYPDGTAVEDVGLAYEGGRCEFTLKNLVPGRPVLMLVRMDYVHGDWEAEMEVNSKKVGYMRCSGMDRKHRWRNWPFVIAAEHVRDVDLRITQIPTTEQRDINYFHIWAYQPEEE